MTNDEKPVRMQVMMTSRLAQQLYGSRSQAFALDHLDQFEVIEGGLDLLDKEWRDGVQMSVRAASDGILLMSWEVLHGYRAALLWDLGRAASAHDAYLVLSTRPWQQILDSAPGAAKTDPPIDPVYVDRHGKEYPVDLRKVREVGEATLRCAEFSNAHPDTALREDLIAALESSQRAAFGSTDAAYYCPRCRLVTPRLDPQWYVTLCCGVSIGIDWTPDDDED